MDWTCQLTEERLSDYLDGLLSASELASFEAHRSSCAQCAGLLSRVGGVVMAMRGLAPIEHPAQLESRILEATLGPRPKKSALQRWFAWTPFIWQPRFAIGMVTVAVCAVIVIQAGGVIPTKMHKANLNPADVFRSVTRQAHMKYSQGVRFVDNLRVVYEIESRLETENPPQQQAPPPPRRQSQPNPNYPQQKSETHRNRSGDGIVYAVVAPGIPNLNQGSQAAAAAANAPAQTGQRHAIGWFAAADILEPEWSPR
jgi:hypothetical protein